MNLSHLLFTLVLFATLLLAGCSREDAPAPVVPEGAQADELTEMKACEFQPADGETQFAAECGTLVVPENRDKADSRLIALPVVRIPATGPNTAEPVFYLQGGPGQSNLSWEPPNWLLENHAVVFVGYRGIDGTVTLSCPEVSRVMKTHVSKDLFSEQARAESVVAVKQCAATYQDAGVDLSGYTVPGVIEDVEAARTALGYDRINLLSESYGTRVAQIYAYMHPDSLHRLVLIGVNTPGHFVWNPAVFDKMIGHFSELCGQDVSCSSRTSNLAQTMYAVNHSMPKRWLFFNIDPDTVRLATHYLFFENPNMAMVFDAYLAAAEGNPSGLAMLNLIMTIAPIDRQIFGDQAIKAGTLDLEKYRGIESISLGDSIMGAPMSEQIWPMAKEWPLELIPKDLREFQETDVEMLLVNGTVDFSTPPTALDEAKPYFHKAQMVFLPEFSHTGDVMQTLQPEAFERLITSYYDTGVADASLYVYQPLSFAPGMSLTVMAKLLVAAMIVLPALLILGVLWVVRRMRSRRLLMQKSLAPSVPILLAAVILLSQVGSAKAQEDGVAPVKDAATAPAQPQGPTDPAELEAFLDDLFSEKMEEYHIAGAAIAVVKDGELFFAKGYGYADIEKGIPVDPEQTIFHVGSVGKTFTWTAVMQLAEQGKLDLDADVNTYLDFRIPDTYPQPITLKHLMTHTSGFEERWLESLASDASELVPAREWLVSNMAARVRPPGESAGYSNFNAMLAGYIVARVSGQPYDQYIQEHIYDPLGMAHSTAQSPTPPDLRANLSVGYTYGEGAFHPFPDYVAQPVLLPSGAHQASVTDMARFMIAHLEDGRYSDAAIGEARILEEATARQMRTTLYTPDPRLPGAAYGFTDLSDNGQRTLGHQGFAGPMQSQLLLLPDQHLGIFLVFNTRDIGDLTTQHFGFQRAFFDYYFPAPAAAPLQPPADFAERAGRFVGAYRLASAPASTPDKVAGVFGGYTVQVSAPGDGTLHLATHGAELPFVEVEPLYFRQVDGPFAIVFREDDRGRITHLFTNLQPQYGAVKLDWYELPGFNMPLFLVCVLIFLSMLLVAVVRFVWDRRPGSDRRPASGGARVAGWVIVGICLLNLLFLVGFALWFRPPTELHGVALTIKIVLGLGVLAAALTAGALVYTVLAWKDGYWGVVFRTYYTLVTVAAVAFVWLLNQWNLLGWRF